MTVNKNDFRFVLERKGRKKTCPYCGKKGKFRPYIDIYGKYTFPDHVGRCDRENNCMDYGWWKFFEDNPDERIIANGGNSQLNLWHVPSPAPKPEKQIEYFDERVMTATMAQYGKNSFINALRSIFDENQIRNIINRYRLGTTQAGAVVFWQVDMLGRVRYGKAMYYLSSLRRDKLKHPVGVHSLIGRHGFNHRQCFFGEHLLAIPENRNRTVAIVESEKTACICSEVMPDYVWLATGGKNSVKWREKNTWACLKGRNVMLFPDVDAHDDWVKLLPTFRSFGIYINVCDFLMNVAHGSQDDIVDYLMRKEQPLVRLMTDDELRKLAAGLPDHDSFTETELCRILNIEPSQVQAMQHNQLIYFIGLSGKYCRSGCTPF